MLSGVCEPVLPRAGIDYPLPQSLVLWFTAVLPPSSSRHPHTSFSSKRLISFVLHVWILQSRAGDRLGRRETGDLMVVEGCGAYVAGMSAKNYNSFPEAAEVGFGSCRWFGWSFSLNFEFTRSALLEQAGWHLPYALM